jgi:hypothetical protein
VACVAVFAVIEDFRALAQSRSLPAHRFAVEFAQTYKSSARAGLAPSGRPPVPRPVDHVLDAVTAHMLSDRPGFSTATGLAASCEPGSLARDVVRLLSSCARWRARDEGCDPRWLLEVACLAAASPKAPPVPPSGPSPRSS